MPNWVYATISALTIAAAAALAAAAIIIPEMDAEQKTQDRIMRCNAKGGTARLDRRNIFSGCLIPPP
jgi:hypothetical protein